MASARGQADEYHQQFAERIIPALKEGTAPWQKPWQPGEHVLPHNFSSGRGNSYRMREHQHWLRTASDEQREGVAT